MIAPFELFAPSARNLSDLVEEEALSAGGEVGAVLPGGVAFRGELESIYRFCLHSRCASSLQLTLGTFPVTGSDDLYHAVRSIEWPELFHHQRTFIVDATGKRERAVEHTGFAAQRVKDGIVDSFREAVGSRPSVDTQHPDVRISLFLERKQATLGIDLAGEPLHKRGYRKASGDSVLRETVAAALLKRAGWEAFAAEGKPLLDPFCGSGTILIEAALMAGDIAPGLSRKRFGFRKLQIFDKASWDRVFQEAKDAAETGRERIPRIFGCDKDSGVIRMAEENIRAAGLEGVIEVSVADARFSPPPAGSGAGLVATDPPYGKRSTMSFRDLESLYRSFGENLKQQYGGWQSAILAGDEARECRIGLKPDKINTLWNGSVECSLSIATIASGGFSTGGVSSGGGPAAKGKQAAEGREAAEEKISSGAGEQSKAETPGRNEADKPLSPGAEMAANRLKKNRKKLRKWINREGITCYRLYDADMPEYSAAIDIYESCEGVQWLHLQEYAPPSTIDPASAAKRLAELVDATEAATGIPRQRIIVKQRSRQRGKDQYQRRGESGESLEIFENGLRFIVNLQDFLDTGIFLDHRPVRLRIMEMSKGKRFLNLFAYTGAATVHAAAGGAAATTTVDNSNTYLKWFEQNMKLNGFRVTDNGPSHRSIKADCLSWLAKKSGIGDKGDETERLKGGVKRDEEQFDLIFLDPPTFSNSKDMEESFDVQRDHPLLIEQCLSLLAPAGELIFSTNRRGFSLQLPEEILEGVEVEDITEESIDPDYRDRRRPHQCWVIRPAREV